MANARPTSGSTDFSFWLQADLQQLEIEVCSSPNSGHSGVQAGLPFVTHSGHSASVDISTTRT